MFLDELEDRGWKVYAQFRDGVWIFSAQSPLGTTYTAESREAHVADAYLRRAIDGDK